MRPRSLALLTAIFALATPAVASAADPPQLKTLAYTKYTKTPTAQIWSISQGGVPVKVATNAYGPTVSPRGDLVASSVTTKSSTKLVVANADGSNPRTMVTNMVAGTPVWSPDQTQLAAVVGPEIGKQTLVLINVADALHRTVANGYFSGMSFSPDGAQLAYSRVAKSTLQGLGGDVYTADISGTTVGAAKNLTKDGKSLSPLWGPKSIAFSHLTKAKKKEDYPKANLQSILPDGTGRKTLTKLKIPYLLYGLSPTAWSAEGLHLLAEYGGQDYSEAWTYDLTTGKARDLTGKDDGVIGFGLSADGNTVLAGTGGYDPQSKSDLVTYSFTGKKKKVLVKNATSATWAGF